MSPRHFLLAKILLLSTGLAGWAGSETPDGAAVFICGHSFHQFIEKPLEALAQEAGRTRHRTVGKLFLGNSRSLDIWNLPDARNTAKTALRQGGVDVLTLSPHRDVPDEGIDQFADLAIQKNPSVRVLVQISWSPTLLTQSDPAYWRELSGRYIAVLRDQANRINARHGRTTVELVPIALAVQALRERIEAGTVPGLSSPQALFVDRGLHPSPVLENLVAYCWFVAIYGRNPVGLAALDRRASPEINRILEEIAWEVMQEFSRGSPDGIKPAS